MKKLLMTTTLVSAMATMPVIAQSMDTTAPATQSADTTSFTAPDGYTRQDTVLTADTLMGASIYGPDGSSFGSVHDLVLGMSAVETGAMPGETAEGAEMTDTGMAADTGMTADTDVTTAPDMAADTDTDTAADTGMGAAPGTMETEDALGNATDTQMTDDVEVVEPEEATAGMADPAVDDTMSTDTDTDLADSDAVEPVETDTMASTTADVDTTAPADVAETDMAETDTAVTATAPAATAPSASTAAAPEAAITHVIVDVGGFLGLGAHRTAIPISDLQVYANESETRIYLPWSQEQVEALPEYDANDPATLGTSTM